MIGVYQISKRHHRHKRSSRSKEKPARKSDGKAESKGDHKAPSRWTGFIEWYLGGTPEDVLEDRRVKVMVAIAVAGIFVGASALVIQAIWRSDIIYETIGELPQEEFTFETDTEQVMLIVLYSTRDPEPVFMDYTVYRMPAREMVTERTMMIDENDQTNKDSPVFFAYEYETIDLGRPGRYNITLEVINEPDSSSYTLMVMDMPLSQDFWEKFTWTLVGVFVAMLVLTIAVYFTHRRRKEPYIPLVPFVLTDCVLAATLAYIYLA